MDKKNAETRRKLKQIDSVKDFEDLMQKLMVSDEDKRIMWMHYKEKKTLSFIADELGMSESTVKKKHHDILMKVGNVV